MKEIQEYHLIHERGDYPPLATEEIASVWTSSIKDAVGFPESPGFFIYKDGWCQIYSYESVHQKIVEYVFKKINDDHNFVLETRVEFDRRTNEMLLWLDKFEGTRLSKLSTDELIIKKHILHKHYYAVTPYGEPLPYFLKERLQNSLDEYLVRQLGVSAEDYETLITPVYPGYLKIRDLQLWQLYHSHAKICSETPSNSPLARGRTAKRSFSSPFKGEVGRGSEMSPADFDTFDCALSKFADENRWILFDYASLIVDEKYFLQKLEEFKKSGGPKLFDAEKLKTEKDNLVKKYDINALHQYYLALLDDLYYLMDRKKEVLTMANFAGYAIYLEAASRLKLDIKDLLWFLWEEVEKALLGEKILEPKVAKSRIANSVLRYQDGIRIFLDDEQAKTLKKEINNQLSKSLKTEIVKGVPASRGIVTGSVRYLKSAKDCHLMQEGEILLVSNTTPDFMPAIVKAKAIVTNEGGITCHAAVISRELHIPSVVGTKIATQIFKNGDMVEVDAENGIVRKIS